MLVLIFGVGGMIAFFASRPARRPCRLPSRMPRSLVAYPGASPQQVEEEVTFPVEQALQQLGGTGRSQVSIFQHRACHRSPPQFRGPMAGLSSNRSGTALRRKIDDMNRTRVNCRPGTSQPLINDDFGDVFGMMFAVTGPGYSYGETRGLRGLPAARAHPGARRGQDRYQWYACTAGVRGNLPKPEWRQLGISISTHLRPFANPECGVQRGQHPGWDSESVRINPTGEFDDVSQLEQLLISEPGASELIYPR